jgi:hypothetical protein
MIGLKNNPAVVLVGELFRQATICARAPGSNKLETSGQGKTGETSV